LAKSLQMTRCEDRIGVRDHHIYAGHRKYLGDSATHVSGANDSDVLDHGINSGRKINRTFTLIVAFLLVEVGSRASIQSHETGTGIRGLW
jgi:hypothetical protein